MNIKPSPDFPPGSRADITARLRHAVEANETTRLVLGQEMASLAEALDIHLGEIDAHLRRMLTDLE